MEQAQEKNETCTKQSTVQDTRTKAQREYLEKFKRKTLAILENKRSRPTSAMCENWKLDQQEKKVPNHLRYVLEEMYPKETRMEV